jgi:uncharacterized protein YkwD
MYLEFRTNPGLALLGLGAAVAISMAGPALARQSDSPLGGCWRDETAGRIVSIDVVLDSGGRIDAYDPNRALIGLEGELHRPLVFVRVPCAQQRDAPRQRAAIPVHPSAPLESRSPSSSSSLSSSESAVLQEINSARTDPRGYAQGLRVYLAAFRGRLVDEPGHTAVMSHEGPSAVEEAIADLEHRPPAPPLSAHGAAARAASRMVSDQGPSGRLGHVGSDGSTLRQRLQDAGLWAMAMEEDISYGSADPRDVVRQLIVDDGVPDRGHRTAIFDTHMSVAGVACGPHAAWRWMCVVDLAGSVMPAPGSEAATP